MSETPTFHFIDLLSLHLRARLDVPEARGLLPMVQWLSGLRLPGLFLPPPLVEALREEMHRQHPWLRPVQLPRAVFSDTSLDWPVFWAWVDVLQRRTCAELGIEPDAFVLEPIDQGRFASGVIIIISDPDEG